MMPTRSLAKQMTKFISKQHLRKVNTPAMKEKYQTKHIEIVLDDFYQTKDNFQDAFDMDPILDKLV